jgi:hypothetical protein
MWDELENALAWYAAAPKRWVDGAKKDLDAAAEWIWVVIQGDFAEEQTTAQTITSTVISMIPVVDQICDVRDVVANCRKINQDTSNKWAWVALVLTLIGLFPTLGSLAKGCFKILFAYGRKSVLKAGKTALDSDFWKASKPFVESGIQKLTEFLARPEVRKALAALKWDNAYKELAKLTRELAGQLNVAALTKQFDKIIDALKDLTDLIDKWGNAAMKTKAGELLAMVKGIRDKANAELAKVLKPVQDWLDKLARRLEIEADMNYRAYTNTVNPHAFKKPSLDAELTEFKKKKPDWVDVRAQGAYPAMGKSPKIPDGYPDISDTSKSRATKSKFDTFHDLQPKEIPPGTTLYRVLDPASGDNSICWMTKAEFDKLKSKDDWRRGFAVWANWNTNGEFVTYTVPSGKPLKVWEGVTGSQQIPKTNYWLEGGARQIVLDPADLEKSLMGKRQATGWGYSNFGEKADMVGVPVLKNNWYEPRK